MDNKNLPVLNKTLLMDPGFTEAAQSKGVHVPTKDMLRHREKFITFGEGNFVRSFIYWMIDRMNQRGLFLGRGVALQPINPDLLSQEDLVSALNEQDCLYTTVLRGLREGKVIDERTIVSSMSRILAFKSEAYWKDTLLLARNPALEFVFSQTTEAGIRIHPDDKQDATPPISYPAKLTLFLYERYKHLGKSNNSGLVIIPTELNYRSGDMLKRCVLEIMSRFNLESPFRSWFDGYVTICNAVVDSIITGKPGSDESAKLHKELEYVDNALSIGEPFHLWVIEDKTGGVKKKLPLDRVPELNVQFVEDLEIDHQKKMRILCGAHTSMIAPSYLIGNESVRESIKDPLVGRFTKTLIYDEACRSIDIPYDEARAYSNAIFERFLNPDIHHKLLTLSLNITSKVAERIVPTIVDLCEKQEIVPPFLSFAFAAYLVFMRGDGVGQNGMVYAYRNPHRGHGEKYFINDRENAKFFFDAYRQIDINDRQSVSEFVFIVLGRFDLWGTNLNRLLDGKFTASVEDNLHIILNRGMQKALEDIFREG